MYFVSGVPKHDLPGLTASLGINNFAGDGRITPKIPSAWAKFQLRPKISSAISEFPKIVETRDGNSFMHVYFGADTFSFHEISTKCQRFSLEF